MNADGTFEPVEVESADRRDMRGAEQWRLRPRPARLRQSSPASPTRLKLGRGGDGVARSVLGDDIETFFNDTFSEIAAGRARRRACRSDR